MSNGVMPAVRPDLFGQLAATDPYQSRARRLFERGQVVAVNGNQADVRVGYDARNNALELKQVPIISGYVPRVGDWVAMQYEAGHSSAPWITGPSMAADDASDSAGIGVFPVSETEPEDPQRSAVYFDDSQQTWRGWDGAVWVDFAGKLHNSLPDLQGGAAGQYYHLTEAEYQAIAGSGSGGIFDNMPFGANRVLYADADGHIAHDAGMIYDPATDFLSVLGKLGIGSATVPHGAVGAARLAIDGPNGSVTGPHIQVTTAADDYPLFQAYMYGHDNIALSFDAYWDGAPRSSDVGSNFILFKLADSLSFRCATGVAQGAAVTWLESVRINTAAQFLHTAGTAAAPAIGRIGYADDGIFWPGDGLIGMSISGAERTRWEAAVYAPVTNEAVDHGKAATRWGNAYYKEVVYGSIHTLVFPVAPAGTAGLGADKLGFSLVVPFAGTIIAAYAYAQTAPTGQALVFDMNLNGSTIWSTQANRLQIAAGANSGTQTTFNTTAVARGDRFTCDIDQIGNPVKGSNVTVELVILKTGSAYF